MAILALLSETHWRDQKVLQMVIFKKNFVVSTFIFWTNQQALILLIIYFCNSIIFGVLENPVVRFDGILKISKCSMVQHGILSNVALIVYSIITNLLKYALVVRVFYCESDYRQSGCCKNVQVFPPYCIVLIILYFATNDWVNAFFFHFAYTLLSVVEKFRLINADIEKIFDRNARINMLRVERLHVRCISRLCALYTHLRIVQFWQRNFDTRYMLFILNLCASSCCN